jgi:integrase
VSVHYIETVPLNVLAVVPHKLGGRARKRAMDASKLTFQQLIELQTQRITRGDGPASSAFPNLKSALSAFLQERNISFESPVGSVFRASYYIHLRGHVKTLQENNRTREYISNRRSLLAQWRKCIIDFDKYTAIEAKRAHPFQQAIMDIVAQAPSQRGLARKSGIPLATLKRWLAGAFPNGQSFRQVAKLEMFLGLEPGALGDLLPAQIRPSARTPTDSRPTLAYRERIKVTSKDLYALKRPNDKLRREWQHFVQYKVSEVTAFNDSDDDSFDDEVSLKRSTNGRWSATSSAVAVPTEANWFCFYKGKYVATAGIRWSKVSQFIGWLMLAESAGGKGMAAEDAQTLANLARRSLVKEYLDWRIARTDGLVHGGIVDFLQFVSSLCNPRTGYLTQSGREVGGVQDEAQEAQWRKRCAVAFDSARKMRDELSNSVVVSRDPFEPIQHVLAMPNPLDAIADMVARLSLHKPVVGGTREAVWARDKLFIKLMASNPLRDKNIRMLTYRPDNKGHLRQDERGGWSIFVPRTELKNFHGAARERDYQMSVRPEVWPDIADYLTHYRPRLIKAATDRLFLSEESGGPFCEGGLRKRFEFLTRRYLYGCPGVGPHAMRHIVATAILKASPNDWAAAAWALHDREETVRKHYAHLAQHDAAKWFEKSMNGPFSKMR